MPDGALPPIKARHSNSTSESIFTSTPHRSVADETFEHFILMGSALAAIVDIVMFALAGPLVGLLVAGNAAFQLLALVIHQRARTTETICIDPSGIEVFSPTPGGRVRSRRKGSGVGLVIRRRPATPARPGISARRTRENARRLYDESHGPRSSCSTARVSSRARFPTRKTRKPRWPRFAGWSEAHDNWRYGDGRRGPSTPAEFRRHSASLVVIPGHQPGNKKERP